MSSVHIEGLGLLGSLIGVMLEEQGIFFTWHDTEEKVNAWGAATGAVYPSGDEFDFQCYTDMRELISSNTEEGRWLDYFTELGRWSYTSKNPPHGGADIGVEAVAEVANVTISNSSSLHFNVQRLVEQTRRRYRKQRKEGAQGCDLYVVSHGFEQAERYGWGWHREVQVELSKDFREALEGQRPCIYMRKGYSVMYLYPMPLTDSYYLGTSNNIASEPKERSREDIDEAFEKARERLQESTEGGVRLLRGKAPKQGWRPYAAKDDDSLRVAQDDDVIRIKPQKGSGLRHWPATRKLLLERIV